jgi:ribosomal protein S18 acetylase RimI-like enzyme
MSGDIGFRTDSASLEQVTALLRHTDASFVPPLSSRVDLATYASKIVSHAVRLEAWDGAELVALLAMYCNDPARATAFITSISVAPAFARRGIASALLAAGMAHARAAGMRAIALEVDADNSAARRLYDTHGFATTGSRGPSLQMSLQLDTRNEHE